MIKFLYLLCIYQIPLFSQVYFDVKTTLQEKKEIKIIKSAIMASLKESDWAGITEFKEDYSLWLKNMNRKTIGNNIQTSLIIEVRTPSFLNQGKLLNDIFIEVEFDTSGTWRMDPAGGETSNMITNMLLTMGIKFLSLNTGLPFGEKILAPLMSNVLNEMNRKPSAMERMEATLMAAKIMDFLVSFCK